MIAQAQAMVSRAPGRPLARETRRRPRPRGDEVLVRVRGAGVCHTDLDLVEDPELPRPLVLGHEIAGEAEGIGPVLVYPAWGCGACDACRRAEDRFCPGSELPGWTLDGGYAEWLLVPSRRYLFPLGALDPVRAAVLGDAGLTAYHAARRGASWLRDGDAAIVIGIGGLGQFAVQVLKRLSRAPVVAVDVAPRKRARALALGADEALAPKKRLPPARVVLDFVGSDESLQRGGEALEPGGLLIQIGAAGGTMTFGLGAVAYDAHVSTSMLGSLDDLAAVLELARRGELTWEAEVLPLDRANVALARLKRGDVEGRFVLAP